MHIILFAFSTAVIPNNDGLSDDLSFSNKYLRENKTCLWIHPHGYLGETGGKKGGLVDVVRGEIIIFLRMSSV